MPDQDYISEEIEIGSGTTGSPESSSLGTSVVRPVVTLPTGSASAPEQVEIGQFRPSVPIVNSTPTIGAVVTAPEEFGPSPGQSARIAGRGRRLRRHDGGLEHDLRLGEQGRRLLGAVGLPPRVAAGGQGEHEDAAADGEPAVAVLVEALERAGERRGELVLLEVVPLGSLHGCSGVFANGRAPALHAPPVHRPNG